jgi:hypothetical protein
MRFTVGCETRKRFANAFCVIFVAARICVRSSVAVFMPRNIYALVLMVNHSRIDL